MKVASLLLTLPLLLACNAKEPAPATATQASEVQSIAPAITATPVTASAPEATPTPAPTAAPARKPPRKASKPAPRQPLPPAKASQAVVVDYYQQGLNALQHGRVSEAQALLRTQLQQTPEHQAARKLLVTLLLDAGKRGEAEQALREGLDRNPAQADLAMLLARLQAERGALSQAQTTLQNSANKPNGPYLAFMGALAQQTGQHEIALGHLDAALKTAPANGKWLLAQGVSRRALGKEGEARISLTQALQSGHLNAEQQKLARQLMR